MTIKTWKLIDFLKQLKTSYEFDDIDTPEGIMKMMRNKANDSQFPAIVHEIQTHGFKVPIFVSEINPGELWLRNGHHRLTAAILLNIDEITTQNKVWSTSSELDDKIYSHPLRDREEAKWFNDQLKEELKVNA